MDITNNLALSSDEHLLFTVEKSKVNLFWSCVVCVFFFWFFFIPIFKVVRDFKEHKENVYAVTDKRVLAQLSWPKGKIDAKPLADVEDVVVRRTAVGGILTIRGTDQHNVYFKYVKDPERVKEQILEAARATKAK